MVKTAARKLAGCWRIVAMVMQFQWQMLLEKKLTHKYWIILGNLAQNFRQILIIIIKKRCAAWLF